jgi:site-specific DNA-methyltransferase (adenine-specific)
MDKNIIYNADCLEILKTLPDNSIDLMVTDIPYATTKLNWDKSVDLQKMWPEWKRVVKQDGAFIFTATQPFATDLINSARDLFKYDLIWNKVRACGFLNANKMPLKTHESILIFYRKLPVYNPVMREGKAYDKTKYNGIENEHGVLRKFKWESKKNEGLRFPVSILEFSQNWTRQQQLHPTQKPVDLFRYLIKTYSKEGDTIFDGYSGSGTAALAAKLENRNFICCETDKIHFEKSVKRLEEQNQLIETKND